MQSCRFFSGLVLSEYGTQTVQGLSYTTLHHLRYCTATLRLTTVPIGPQLRLLESLKKFEQYEALLESIGDNLSARQQQLEEEAAEPIPDLDTAKRRLEATRVSQRRMDSWEDVGGWSHGMIRTDGAMELPSVLRGSSVALVAVSPCRIILIHVILCHALFVVA